MKKPKPTPKRRRQKKHEEGIPEEVEPSHYPHTIEFFLIEEIQAAAKRCRYLAREARDKALISVRMKLNPAAAAERAENEIYALVHDARSAEVSESLATLGRLFSAHTGADYKAIAGVATDTTH